MAAENPDVAFAELDVDEAEDVSLSSVHCPFECQGRLLCRIASIILTAYM